MKILLAADLHFRDKPPSMCTEAYLPELFNHVKYMIELCNHGKADAVALAGDIFDNKIAFHNSHRLVQTVIRLFKSFNVPVFVIPGNHDLTNDRVESVFETQPLGCVYLAGAAKILSGWAHDPVWKEESYSSINGITPVLPLYGLPWLAEWDIKDNDKQRHRAVEQALEGIQDNPFARDQPILVVTHAPFFPPGHESPWENYPTPQFASRVQKSTDSPVSVYYGHIHTPHGIYNVSDVNFANAGALSRGSLAEYNIHRPIQLTVWDSDTGLFEIFEIPHLPASEIFRMEHALEVKKEKLELSGFVGDVGSTVLEISSVESVVDYVRQIEGVEDSVVDVVQNLLEEVNP